MPQAAIAGLAKVFIAIGVTAGTATFFATVFVYAASAVILNAAAKALAPKARGAGLGSGTEINYFDTAADLRVAYGQMRVGGMETIPPLTIGENNRELIKVLTLAGTEIDSFNSTHFDNTAIPNSAISPNTGAGPTSDGLVTVGSFANHAFVRLYRGNSLGLNFDARLASVGMSGQANGFATAAVGLIFNQSIFPQVPTLTFTIQGKRLYDPRLDPVPGASPTNTAYIAWSANPALCTADYLMGIYGGGYDADEIDWSTVVTAANYCDGLVDIPGSLTQKRYTCNGILFANEDFTENVKALIDAMLGRIIFRDGKWRMYAGSWQTPSFTIPKNAWVSGMSFRFERGRQARFNRAHVFYVDAARDYQRVECLPQSDSGYLTADGGEPIDLETEQLLCTNELEAQRKGRFLLRQSRNQISVAGTLPPRFQDIAIWDTGTIVFDFLGWSSKTFRASNITLRPDGALDCVFSEEQETDWEDLDAADYNTQTITPLPATNATTPSAPTSFSATEQINGTILFTLGTPIIRPTGTLFQIIRSTNSADASVGTVIYEGANNTVPLTMPTSRHWYYSRAIVNSLVSAYQPNTFGIAVIARPIADATFNAFIVSDPELDQLIPVGEYWTNSYTDVISFNPTGGQVGGAIVIANSPGASFPLGRGERIAFNIPKEPFRRNRAGIYRSIVRFKVDSADIFVTEPKVRLYGWTGVGVPNLNNVSSGRTLFTVPTGAGLVVGSDNYPEYGQWMDGKGITSLNALGDGTGWTINPASYPYLCVGIFAASSSTLGAEWKCYVDRVEIFFSGT